MFWTYHRLKKPRKYCFKTISTNVDNYNQTKETFLLLGGFNVEDTERSHSTFLEEYANKIK